MTPKFMSRFCPPLPDLSVPNTLYFSVSFSLLKEIQRFSKGFWTNPSSVWSFSSPIACTSLATEDEMVEWYHRLDGHEFECGRSLWEIVRDREAWRAAVHGGCKESGMTTAGR